MDEKQQRDFECVDNELLLNDETSSSSCDLIA